MYFLLRIIRLKRTGCNDHCHRLSVVKNCDKNVTESDSNGGIREHQEKTTTDEEINQSSEIAENEVLKNESLEGDDKICLKNEIVSVEFEVQAKEGNENANKEKVEKERNPNLENNENSSNESEVKKSSVRLAESERNKNSIENSPSIFGKFFCRPYTNPFAQAAVSEIKNRILIKTHFRFSAEIWRKKFLPVNNFTTTSV